MRLRRRTVLAWLAVGSLLFLVALSLGKWWSFERVSKLLPEVAELEFIEGLLHEIDRDALVIHAARRSYVITGDVAHARRVEQMAAELPTHFEPLRQALVRSGNSEKELQALSRIEAMLSSHVQRSKASVADYRVDRDDQVRQQGYAEAGEIAVEEIHVALQALEEAVEIRFRADMTALTSAVSNAQRLSLVLLAGAALTTTSALFLARGEIGRREAALQEVSRQRAGLESEVERRTKDLRFALERYRNLVELSEDAILLCGSDMRIRYANPAAEALLASLGQEQPMGRPLQGMFFATHGPRLLAALDGVWSGSARLGYTASALAAADGSGCPVEVTAAGYKDGAEVQLLVVIHDLRAQKLQEAAVRDQLEFIEQLVEAVPLPLSLRDADGRFVRVNRAFELFHDVQRSEVIGRDLQAVLMPEDPRSLDGKSGQALNGDAAEFEATVASRGGAARIVQVRQQAIRRHDASLAGVLSLETDVTALRQHEQDLREHGERLGHLATQLIAAQEEERRRVARELHDQVGQILTALRLQLGTALQLAPASADALHGPMALADEALAHTRDLTSSLHPHVLDDLGLKAALSWLLKRYILPSLPVVHFDCRVSPERADPAIELAAFRVVQEALTNTLRHARANSAELSLFSGDGWLRIDISDDGEGFAVGDTWFDGGSHRSVGMSSMRERVEDLGGEFAVDSSPGMGTQLRVLLPWPTLTFSRRGAADARIAG